MQQLKGCYGFLGYGNMGEAILGGVLEKGLLLSDQIYVFDPLSARREAAHARGVICVDTPDELAAACDTLLLAVKPQTLQDAVTPLLGNVAANVRIISIMAGISIAALQEYFGKQSRILRVMPNTPALVGAGAAALAHSDTCGPEDINVGKLFFDAVGTVVLVPESSMDAVTAVSGSGPAYFFYLAECLIDAAIAEGLPEDLASHLAAHTLLGAGTLLVASNKSAAALRDQVTSKGGTTFAALETMRKHDFQGMIKAAVHAAAARSRELGN